MSDCLSEDGREYIDVAWLHASDAYPVRLLSELDCERYETRKLEFFRDGRVGYAGPTGASPETELGYVPAPPLAKIDADPEFCAKAISASEFERLWDRHVSQA